MNKAGICLVEDEVFEIKSKDHKVFTSSIRGEDGQWFTFLKVHYRRTK